MRRSQVAFGVILALLLAMPWFSCVAAAAKSVSPVARAAPTEWDPSGLDPRVAIIGTIAVIIFALVVVIIASLKKGRSDGFGMHR